MDMEGIINEVKASMTRLENIALAVLAAAWFMPFSQINGFGKTASGFLIPWEYDGSLTFIFYIVPVLAIISLVLRPKCRNPEILKKFKLSAAIGAIFAISYFMFAFNVWNYKLGLYVAMLSAIAVIVGTLGVYQLPKALPAVDNQYTKKEEAAVADS